MTALSVSSQLSARVSGRRNYSFSRPGIGDKLEVNSSCSSIDRNVHDQVPSRLSRETKERFLEMEIRHFGHEHPLVLRALSVDEIHKNRCDVCEEPIMDLMYCCKRCESYHIHRSCSKLPQKIAQHPFHLSHPLPIQMRGHYACCGCGQWHDKVHYWCVACNFTLSPDCALKPSKKYEFLGREQIRYFLHGHPLSLADGKPMGDDGDEEVCLACEKALSGPSYSCHQCPSFKLHKSCIEQLPRAIRHFSHPEHPMILRGKDEWFDRPCAACGRSDNVLTYRCSMCKIELDPQCALKPTKHLI